MNRSIVRITEVFLCFLLVFNNPMAGQYNPHPDTITYLEPYRGQFHFSPATGWMNDINALVYQGGEFHMIYQWGKKIRHGGYATSPDLLHWIDKGVALIPQQSDLSADAVRNVSGNQVFSGSGLVVTGEIAKQITGSATEAMVAIYTGTSVGTCLAWSIDTGQTWHDYAHNPVANPIKEYYPRDPCVMRYAPTSTFIMALYQEGTTFYGSRDLIHWDSLSNLDFGYECPDIYRLPLDGDTTRYKWVLQDANGSYLVGAFDGTHFIKDADQDTFVMDVGPDFYAAQTFPRGNLPNHDPRIIQLAWMDHWNGGIGEKPWERNATFPVTLGLVTYKGQKRITRKPIHEISNLYKSTRKWDDQILSDDTNPLEDVASKQFMLSVDIDLSKTSATAFGIRIVNKTVSYHCSDHTLLGKTLLPDKNNHISFTILADWGQLEVFANHGIFSYTQEFGFWPERNDITFFANGNVHLVSMEFHELAGIWND